MKVRNSKGSMAILGFIGLMPLLAAIGAFGVDMMHVNSTKGELQKACDAGALAGANQLWKYESDNGASAIQAGQTVTALNPADGKLVADADPGITVNVTIPEAPVNGIGGKVQVDATMQIRGIFSHLFGANFQTVTASSQAGPLGKVTTAFTGSLFPLAVSISKNGPDGTKIGDKNLGDTFVLGWKPGVDNVFWCGLENSPSASNANNVGDMIDAYHDPSKPNGHPALSVGDMTDLTNGVQAVNIGKLTGFNGKTLVMPLVDLTGYSSPTKVIGWVGFKVTGVTVNGANSEITGTITNAMIHGTGGAPPPDPNWQTFMDKYQISPAKLLQ